MTATHPSLIAAIDLELDRVYRHREHLLQAESGPARSQLLADLFDHEAWLWSTLFERTRSRLIWRAALAAEAHARISARWWRRQAATDAAEAAPPVPQVGAA